MRIGVLFSKTGARSVTEASMRDAAAMAVEEINNDGGVLGKQVEIIAVDAESKDNVYKGSLVQLVNKSMVSAVFCNLPVGARAYILPKVEQSNSLLFDLSDYVGERNFSPGLICLGSSPDQLLKPGIQYLLGLPKHPYSKFYLMGTEDAYSKGANKIIKAYLLSQGIARENIRESLVDVTSEDLADEIVAIKRYSTDGKACVLNTMQGAVNLAFFKEFANQGLSSLGCPIMSFTISEDELRQMGAEFIIGHLFSRNYFQSVDTDKNIRFVSDFRLFCAINELPEGVDRVTGEAINRAYTGIYLWKKAVEKAGSFDRILIEKALYGLEFNSPAGMVQINDQALSLNKPIMVGESDSEGQINVLWHSEQLVPGSVDKVKLNAQPIAKASNSYLVKK
ncbi:transporter substrate-binding protein [Adhaeribacter aquaticus]|uniref:transporter substrate-binding protein n=1 Tax=Adhaeribacter aquaticus TaxID=299567 RepID=UPI0008FEE8BC|nr:transporter substrate-binding protein [Adhaeribacter aquaticus]